MEYVVQWPYRSSLGGPWQAGERVTLDDDTAAAISRDSPGVLLLVAEAQALGLTPPDGPPADRMVKTARRRGGSSGQ